MPIFGYIACAWAAFLCYGTMMAASYFVGRRYYPIPYQLGKLALYTLSAALLWGASWLLTTGNIWIDFPTRFLLLSVFIGSVLLINKRTKVCA